MRYFLGLDGGGTKTCAQILDESGKLISEGQGGPCNIANLDDLALEKSVSNAASAALYAAGLPPSTRFSGVCAGVAGYSAVARRKEFHHLLCRLFGTEAVSVEPDFVIAYWGATGGDPGIVISAGTGSVVYARNAAGADTRLDGRGFLLGDRGSGFYIGHLALRRTSDYLDEERTLDGFDQKLMAEIEAETLEELIQWVYRDFSQTRVASLAGPIGRWADAGDETAIEILEVAGHLLSIEVVKAARRLEMPLVSTSIYCLGGLWNISPILFHRFERHLKIAAGTKIDPAPAILIEQPKQGPAFGAALIARQNLLVANELRV